MFSEELVVIGAMFLAFLFMAAFLYLGWMLTKKPKFSRSPYTNLPLRSAETLPFETKKRIYYYLEGYHQYDNRPFKIHKAAYCRETGRVFSDCVDWKGRIKLDWSFLQKRMQGVWISWGSLSDALKEQIRARHEDLEGFQTELCSKEPSPRNVEAKYAYAKPGPLYVDINTAVLMGWKTVPEIELEVLIVQKPIR